MFHSSFFVSKIFVCFFLVILIITFFACLLASSSSSFSYEFSYGESILRNNSFSWPTPGFTRITSPYGKRNAPAKGSSTFHSGIDIGAPEGSYILAVCDGEVSFLGFKGAGGYTLTIKSQNLQISYCHISPTYLVSIGDIVKKGNVIAKVGPYHVYGVPDNPYRDKNGEPTNGATTGCHLHLTIKKDGKAVNPLDFFKL